jgi:hypothetical protein
MPLVTDLPGAPEEPIETITEIAKPEWQDIIVDTTYDPDSTILVNIEGSPWTVDYFSQVLNSDSALSGQSVNREAIYQQYAKINSMILKVTTPLAQTQDDETKAMVVTGAANVYPFLIPNAGDMFLADIGDGREAVFQITNSERKTIFKNTCYSIEYMLIDYATDLRKGDLLSKVVKEYFYVNSYLMYGRNPLVTKEEWINMTALGEIRTLLTNEYFDHFSSTEYKTLMLPDQTHPTYDPFLMKNITKFFSNKDSFKIRMNRILNCDGDEGTLSPTIWDAMVKRDARVTRRMAKQVGVVPVSTFPWDPVFEGIYYSGFSYVVYPTDPVYGIDKPTYMTRKQVRPNVLKPSKIPSIIGTLDGVALITPVLTDTYYIFSEAFYTQTSPGQSVLELCVWDYLSHKAIETHKLVALANDVDNWGEMERFYFIPFILILIKACIGSD